MARTQRISRHSAARSAPRRRWTSVEGRAALDAWRASGLSMAAFARQRGVRVCRLIWWRTRLADSPTAPTPMQFLPIAIRNTDTALVSARCDDTIEIVLGRGVTLRVPDEFNERTLVRIVETLARSRC